METCLITILFSLLGLLLDIVENVGACNLNPVANDIPHILLLYVSLYDLIVRANVLDCVCRNLALVLLVSAQLKSLALQVV